MEPSIQWDTGFSVNPPAAGMPAAARGEQRAVHRRRVLKSGIVHAPAGTGSVDVVVRNLSSLGAMADVDPLTEIAEDLVVTIASEKLKRMGRLVWRDKGRFAVRFL